MKMSQECFQDLKADMNAIVSAQTNGGTTEQISTLAMAWKVFHHAAFDRSYEDHPAYESGRKRILPVGRNWYDRIYEQENLDDVNVVTAFKKICPNMETGK